MPVDGPSYLVGRTDEKVLTMFWSSINYRCLWTGPKGCARMHCYLGIAMWLTYVEDTFQLPQGRLHTYV
jgi:hypothetical protein